MYRFRLRHLKLVGGSFYTGASYTNWCGHTREFIPVPAVEAWLRLSSRRSRQGSNTGSNPVGATTIVDTVPHIRDPRGRECGVRVDPGLLRPAGYSKLCDRPRSSWSGLG